MNGGGLVWMIRKQGGPRVDGAAAARGWFRWAGEYWQDNGGGWGPARGARYFSHESRHMNPHRAEGIGGEWVAVFVNVPVDGGQA